MIDRYELEDDDRYNVCLFKLNEYLNKFGTSFDEWYKEKNDNE